MNRENIFRDVCQVLGLTQINNSWVRTLGLHLGVLEQVGDDYEQRVFVACFANGTSTNSGSIEVFDTFTDFPLVGEDTTLYVTKDSNVIYRYDSALNTYVLLNDPDVVNPDAPEEGGTFYVRLATSNRLNPCTYNNGATGVGATLTGNSNGILSDITSPGTIDVRVPVLGNVILVKNQTSAFQNGIYEVTQLGDVSNPFILTRIDGYDETAEIYPSIVFVAEGSNNANRYFSQSTANPVIGTSNLVYGVSSTAQPALPLLFINTVTTTALPASTYTNGTVYPTLPGWGATLRANANGALGTINGVPITSGVRIIVKDQVNQAHNGTYTVTNAGSATQRWVLTRWLSDSSQWYNNRTFHVTDPRCNQFGSRWSVSSPLSMPNSAYGTTNIVWSQLNNSGLRDGNGDINLSTLNNTGRINIYDGNQIDIFTDGSIAITADNGQIDTYGAIHSNGYIYLKNYGTIYGSTDGGFEFTTNKLYLGDAANLDTSWSLGNASGSVITYDATDMNIQCTTGKLTIQNSTDDIDITAGVNNINLYAESGEFNLYSAPLNDWYVGDTDGNKGYIKRIAGVGIANNMVIHAGTGYITLSSNYLNVSGIPVYANDAAADADSNLAANSLYKLTGNRTIFQKP